MSGEVVQPLGVPMVCTEEGLVLLPELGEHPTLVYLRLSESARDPKGTTLLLCM